MAENDWMTRTFTQSVPNPAWEVSVTHVPSGITRTACGRGGGSAAAARELREDIEQALRYWDVVTVET
jgi:hypothetical protein